MIEWNCGDGGVSGHWGCWYDIISIVLYGRWSNPVECGGALPYRNWLHFWSGAAAATTSLSKPDSVPYHQTPSFHGNELEGGVMLEFNSVQTPSRNLNHVLRLLRRIQKMSKRDRTQPQQGHYEMESDTGVLRWVHTLCVGICPSIPFSPPSSFLHRTTLQKGRSALSLGRLSNYLMYGAQSAVPKNQSGYVWRIKLFRSLPPSFRCPREGEKKGEK